MTPELRAAVEQLAIDTGPLTALLPLFDELPDNRYLLVEGTPGRIYAGMLRKLEASKHEVYALLRMEKTR